MLPAEQVTKLPSLGSVVTLNIAQHVRGKDLLTQGENRPVDRINPVILKLLLGMTKAVFVIRFQLIVLQRNIYVMEFGQLEPFLSVRLIRGQIPAQVILNNFHRPLDAQRF